MYYNSFRSAWTSTQPIWATHPAEPQGTHHFGLCLISTQSQQYQLQTYYAEYEMQISHEVFRILVANLIRKLQDLSCKSFMQTLKVSYNLICTLHNISCKSNIQTPRFHYTLHLQNPEYVYMQSPRFSCKLNLQTPEYQQQILNADSGITDANLI
jgi:hypothetical protein